MPTQSQLRFAKIFIFLLALAPLGFLIYQALNQQLGANPVEKIMHRTGDWSLRFLLLTLTITPLRRFTGWSYLLRFRRMLGLFAFFYVCLHFTNYLWLDQYFDWREIQKDIVKRPYITIGFTGFLLLIPLALTSTDGMMRRLGRRWAKLHRLVYVIAVCGVFHFLWLVKADTREPLIYMVFLLCLLLVRTIWFEHYWRLRASKREK